jgi:hypothetical protein
MFPVIADHVTIYRNDDSKASPGRICVSAILAALVLAGFSAASIIQPAHAGVITPEEHWRYNVHWYWDPEERESVGLITPTIVIENRTLDRLEGYVADANGTRLDMYDGEQVVKVRYGYDGSIVTDWELASWIHDGYFAIDIPEKHKNADFISLYIGNNSYTIDDGDINTRNSFVSINSIRTDFRLGSTAIPADETSSAEIELVAGKTPMPGSLIDRILSMFGML